MKFSTSSLVVAAVLALAVGAAAQPRPILPKDREAQKKRKQAARQDLEIQRFEKMTPEQRRKAIDKLPPERRARIEERFRNLQQMPPEERRRLRQRFETFQALPDERKRAVRQELRQLRGLSPEERQKRLRSPNMKKRFNDDERRLLEEVSGNGPPAF